MKRTLTPNLIDTVNDIVINAKSRGVVHQYAEDAKLSSKYLTIDGKRLINFGSCSYLGLELDARLKRASIEAVENFGTQFSCSRTYVSCTNYQELEQKMEQIFDAPILLSTSVTMGHSAVIPIIMEEGDLVVMDQQCHACMQDPIRKLQLCDIPVEVIRHNRLEELEKKIVAHINKVNRVWYVIDGVYSMYGDVAPLEAIHQLMLKYPQLYLYCDDAHGMSWTGHHGSGYAFSQPLIRERTMMATGLAKGFASAGGVFVFPNAALRDRVKNWGGPLTFSGPQQPAVVGASIASANIHLSDEIYDLQRELRRKMVHCVEVLKENDLPLVSDALCPIFFIGLGLTRVGYNMLARLKAAGFNANLGIFPAVPETCTGVRFTLTNHLDEADITRFAETLAYHLPRALKEEGRSVQDIKRAFRKLTNFEEKGIDLEALERGHSLHEVRSAEFQHAPSSIPMGSSDQYTIESTTIPSNGVPSDSRPPGETNRQDKTSSLRLHVHDSIEHIPKELWNKLLGSRGAFDWEALKLYEHVFAKNDSPQHRWKFFYYLVMDEQERPLIATFFTATRIKDDLFTEAAVSRKIEQKREQDPYYLTSRVMMMGTMATNGEHLYIDKGDPRWRQALSQLVDQLWKDQDNEGANAIYLRDIGDDPELMAYFHDQGFVQLRLPDNYKIPVSEWADAKAYEQWLPKKKRKNLRQAVLRHLPQLDHSVKESLTSDELGVFYNNYLKVAERNRDINTFALPLRYFEAMNQCPHFEFLSVRSKEHPMSDFSFAVSYKGAQTYCPQLIGHVQNSNEAYSIYKSSLYLATMRAKELKRSLCWLGLTTGLEKRKLGAVAVPQYGFVQILDKKNMDDIQWMLRT